MYKRSIWSIIRKAKRSLILLAIFMTTTLLIITSLMISEGIGKGEEQLNKGNNAIIQVSINNPSIQQGEKVDDKLFEQLIKEKSVKSYGTDLTGMVNTDKEAVGEKTSAEEMGFGGELDGASIEIPPNSLSALDDSQFNADFNSKAVELASGDVPKEKNEVLVSTDYLEKNNLTIGDSIKLKQTDMLDNNKESSTDVKITGTFKVNSQEEKAEVRSLDKRNNIYMPTQGVIDIRKQLTQVTGGTEVNIPQISLELNNGENTQNFINSIKADGKNYENISFSTSDDKVELFKNSLGSLKNVTKIILYLSVIVSIVILFLIMQISFRERRNEFGILLSLGESKLKILTQNIIETMILVFVSVVLVVGIGSPVVNKLGSDYINEQLSSINSSSDKKSAAIPNGLPAGAEVASDTNTDMEEELSPISIGNYPRSIIFETILIIIISAGVATTLPLLFLLRKHPREILVQLD